jgi:mannose-6-phosphate isomerase-like protein (cupin superfamily)
VVSTEILLSHQRKPILKKLQRHRRTPEILVALQGDSVICVAEPSSGARIRSVKTFLVKEGDAIAMRAGTWHWLPFPTKVEECKFLVMFASDTESSDLETRDLPENLKITYR